MLGLFCCFNHALSAVPFAITSAIFTQGVAFARRLSSRIAPLPAASAHHALREQLLAVTRTFASPHAGLSAYGAAPLIYVRHCPTRCLPPNLRDPLARKPHVISTACLAQNERCDRFEASRGGDLAMRSFTCAVPAGGAGALVDICVRTGHLNCSGFA